MQSLLLLTLSASPNDILSNTSIFLAEITFKESFGTMFSSFYTGVLHEWKIFGEISALAHGSNHCFAVNVFGSIIHSQLTTNTN